MNFKVPIYLDYHATTPMDVRVLDAMLPYFTQRFGNAASRSHPFGWQANEAIEIARQQVADLLEVKANELIFTSGATEGLNMVMKGLAEGYGEKKKHIITVSTEHHAVLDTVHWLRAKGYTITSLKVAANGRINLESLQSVISEDTLFVSIMWANNETGVIQNMEAISTICRTLNVPLISDATQAVGKIKVSANIVDALVCSAHKFYGPKGIGVVYLNPALKRKPKPLIHGGGHENGFRSGTLNVPAIVGMGEAAKIADAEMKEDFARLSALRDDFEKLLSNALSEIKVNGDILNRLPTVSNFSALFTDSQAVMTKFRSKLAISSGSACSSADPAPSHVLLAMGLSIDDAKGSYRISLGKPTTSQEMEVAGELLINAISSHRDENPMWAFHLQG